MDLATYKEIVELMELNGNRKYLAELQKMYPE